jgi:hypothetical protein
MTDELITRLAAANPVPHDGHLYVAEPARVRPSWKVVLGVVVAMAALGGAGVAIADGLGVFNGISSVQHSQTTGDVIDPATAAYIEGKNCDGPGEPVCHGVVAPQFDTARHLGQLPNGQNIYVLGCAQTYLCTVIGPPHFEVEGTSPLSKSHPSTIFTYLAVNDSDSSANRWFTFGVALDGATSVSFYPKETADGTPTGPQVTVPVSNNFWIYAGPPGDSQDMPNAGQPLTVHFADGTTVTEPANGPNCAAC